MPRRYIHGRGVFLVPGTNADARRDETSEPSLQVILLRGKSLIISHSVKLDHRVRHKVWLPSIDAPPGALVRRREALVEYCLRRVVGPILSIAINCVAWVVRGGKTIINGWREWTGSIEGAIFRSIADIVDQLRGLRPRIANAVGGALWRASRRRRARAEDADGNSGGDDDRLSAKRLRRDTTRTDHIAKNQPFRKFPDLCKLTTSCKSRTGLPLKKFS